MSKKSRAKRKLRREKYLEAIREDRIDRTLVMAARCQTCGDLDLNIAGPAREVYGLVEGHEEHEVSWDLALLMHPEEAPA